MVSLTGLKACTVVPSNDILSLLRTAVFTENSRSATAFPCEIVRDAFAKWERCGNILQPVTSVTLNPLLQYVHMSKCSCCRPFGSLNHSINYKGFCTCTQVYAMVFKEFKDKFWFVRTSNFLKEFKDEWEA